jgi:hypothetical protein
MTSWDDLSQPADVPCAGCGQPTPYAVGPEASHGETLKTPTGTIYRRTHRERSCVLASREAVGGRTVEVKATAQDRVAEHLRR